MSRLDQYLGYGAGCLLRDESSVLPMTAQLRHRRGGEQRCRPERRCTRPTLTNAA